MPVIKCTYAEFDKPASEDNEGLVSYEIEFLVETTNGAIMPPDLVVAQAEAITGAGMVQVPSRGSVYNFLGSVDASSICKRRSIELVNAEDSHDLWIIRAFFEPLQDGESIEKYTQAHPRFWLPEVHTEWVERDVLLTKALCLGAELRYNDGSNDVVKLVGLPGIEYGPGESLENELVAIANACGQQPIDPLVEQRFYPLRHVRRYYPSEDAIDTLNLTFQETVNDGNFLGGTTGQWRYKITTAGEKKNKYVPGVGVVPYVEGTTIFEGNQETHDRFVLNNGMVAFKKDLTQDPPTYYTKTVKNVNALDTGGDIPDPLPDVTVNELFPILVPADQGEEENQPASEPLNLNADGTYTPNVEGSFIRYRHLTPTDYGDFLLPFSDQANFPWPLGS